MPDRGRTGKQKTPVVKNSVNPMWNHILVFDGVDSMELADRSLELTVWDHEKLGTNEFLGGARLNLGLGQWVFLYLFCFSFLLRSSIGGVVYMTVFNSSATCAATFI